MGALIGDPQIFISELIWTVINFFLLLFLLKRFLFTPVLRFMEARKARIDAKIEEERNAEAKLAENTERLQAEKTKSREEAKEDTRMAVDALEQCIGKKVRSYRAPAFSIGKSNKWAFDVLAENGITRDASVYPAVRDFGGFAEFGYKLPTMVFSTHCQMKEFPICTTKLWGKEMAFSGGGYFRFFSLNFVVNEMKKNEYNMAYFHIGDIA